MDFVMFVQSLTMKSIVVLSLIAPQHPKNAITKMMQPISIKKMGKLVKLPSVN